MAGPLRLVIDQAPLGGAENMARDELLYRRVEEGDGAWLRLYGWRTPTLSLGFGQSFRRGVDGAFCRDRGIDVVRRITGGRAVLHAREYTYAAAIPYASAPGEATLAACYDMVADALVAALAATGVSSERGTERRPKGAPEACFAACTRHEILASGRKLVGSAQRRGRLGFLQHGSILKHSDAAMHLGAMGQPPDTPVTWIGLEELSSPVPTLETLARALGQALAVALGRDVEEAIVDDGPDLQLLRSRHASRGWIERV